MWRGGRLAIELYEVGTWASFEEMVDKSITCDNWGRRQARVRPGHSSDSNMQGGGEGTHSLFAFVVIRSLTTRPFRDDAWGGGRLGKAFSDDRTRT